MAVQRTRKNANGTYDADFIPVVAWRQTADYVNRYLQKGNRVAVEGAIQTRNYDAQDGTKRWVTELVADRVEGLTPRNTESRPAEPAAQENQEFTEVDDNELPF